MNLRKSCYLCWKMSFLMVFVNVGTVFAVPPATMYYPGETENPACNPGEVNCNVDLFYRPGDFQVSGGVKIGTSTSTLSGMMRFNGTNFQGYNGTSWSNLDNATGEGAAAGIDGNIQISDGSNFVADAALFWDRSAHRLGLGGIPAPVAMIDVKSDVAAGIKLHAYGAGEGTTTEIQFVDLVANGEDYVGFKAPDDITSTTIWTLPVSDGSAGEVLQTSGMGVLSWGIGGGGIGEWTEALGILEPTTGTDDVAVDTSDFYIDVSENAVGIGTVTPTAGLEITNDDANALRINPFGVVAGNTGEIQFRELMATGSNHVGFKAPDDIVGNVIWVLPNIDSTGTQYLQSDGSGALSWGAPAGAGDVTDVGSCENGACFVDVTASGKWLGLGAAAGRIEFDDQATDEVNILDANVGIGTATPVAQVEVEVVDTANIPAMILDMDDVTNNPNVLVIENAGTGDAINVTGTTGVGISMTNATAGQWMGFADGTDVFGLYNHAGTPEGSIAADIGSLAVDTVAGALYVKTTDTFNTGWVSLSGGSGDIVAIGDVSSGAAFTETAGQDGNNLYFEGTGVADENEVRLWVNGNPATDVAVELPYEAATLTYMTSAPTDNAVVLWNGVLGEIDESAVTATELDYLGSVIAGTAMANKALVLDSGDDIEGIDSIAATTFLGTTFDTNVVVAGVTLSGTTLAVDGTDADINIELIPKGAGTVRVPVNYEVNVAHNDDLVTKKWVEDKGYAAGSGDIGTIGDCTTGDCFTQGSISGNILYFEGSTDDDYELVLTAADQTVADHTFTFPNDEIADDDLMLGSGAGTFDYIAVPNCTNAMGHLNYDVSTNTFGCGTDDTGTATVTSLTDTVISSETGGDLLLWDGTDSWDNQSMSGDATISADGTVTVADDSHSHVYSDMDATTSANWQTVVSDETGSGSLVFATNPTLISPTFRFALRTIGDVASSALGGEDNMIMFDTLFATTDRTIELPDSLCDAGDGTEEGIIYTIKDGGAIGAYNLILDPTGSNTIDGATTFTMRSPYSSVDVFCGDDTARKWYIK